ncbi:MAG: hypothetical protein JXR37_03560 [Kiritimatiellae bacterium]|nr:hypothetical protein [Kiritimatiellia bacterium]
MKTLETDRAEAAVLPDAVYVERAAAGMSHAFDCLQKRYAHAVYAFVYARLRRAPAARCVTEAIFREARESLSGREGAAFYRWLYAIAARHCREWEWRGGLMTRRLSTGPGCSMRGAVAAGRVEWGRDAAGDFDAFLEVFVALPDDERLVVTWRHDEGLTAEQIAQRLDKHAFEVVNLLLRAQARIKSVRVEGRLV